MSLETRAISTSFHGRYLVERSGASSTPPLFVGFHGYAQTASAMVEPLQRIAPSGSVIVSIQALNRFYARGATEVVANWMTREDRELMIADNAEYVRRVIDEVKDGLGGRFGPLVCVGFSQGASMAYRAAAHAGHECAAVIALGGDLPPDISDDDLARIPRVLVGRGTSEDWYTEAKLNADLARFSAARVRFEAKIYAGGHEWTAEFIAACQAFVNSLLIDEH